MSKRATSGPEEDNEKRSVNRSSREKVEDERIDDYEKEDKTQEESEKKFGFMSEHSRRVVYRRKPSKNSVDLADNRVDNDRTIRAEEKFLKQCEKCKSMKQIRTCVCPLDSCYQLKDQIEYQKSIFHRIWLVTYIACCPPLCCLIPRVAFFPPRCGYYFFIPPPNDQDIDVRNASDSIVMKKRKKKLNKLSKAKKCEQGKRYRIGIPHPCANDVDGVEGFVVKTARNNTIACVHIECPQGNPRFTLLYSHPNGSDLSDHLVGMPSLIDLARFHRCDVYSYDYSGYGMSGGSASETNTYADINAIYQYLTTVKQIPPKKIVLLGYSIGSAVSIELIRNQKDNPPAGLILQAPPTSLLRVIGSMMGKKDHLKKETCCMDRFRTIDKISEIGVPVLVIHGMKDRTVPISHGQLICEMAVNKTAPEWVKSGAHDNIENCREVWLRIRRFVKKEIGLNVPNGISKNCNHS